jgi:hypothetical protein
METTVRTQAYGTVAQQAVATICKEPKRLSKAAIWRQNNPDGIFVIVDRRAVMK